MKIDELVKLIEVIKASDFHEFTFETGEVKLSLRRGGSQVELTPVAQESTATTIEPAPISPAAPVPAESGLVEVNAPMVGTFYQASSPASEPFVQPGTQVSPGDTLCILEAMKLMNEIQAETAGEIVEIAVENGELVEFGQLLFTLRPRA